MTGPDSIGRLEQGEWKWEIDPTHDRFAFDCSLCGSCCRGDIVIPLNLEDLQRMSAFLNFEKTAFLFEENYARELPLEAGGFRPAIRFKEYPEKFCPFLENRLDDANKLKGLCRLHPDLKPLVCSLAPVGRELEFVNEDEAKEKWYFTEPVSGCPGCRERKIQTAKSSISEKAEALKNEHDYFSVMERLQRLNADMRIFREFHGGLHCDEDLGQYLKRWMEKDFFK